MSFKTLKLLSTTALLVSSSVAMAVPFSSFDPRSMGMGGAGVAVGNAATAPLFNPALLSASREDARFALTIPTIGIRVADPDKLSDSITQFQDGKYLDNVSSSVTALNTAINNAANYTGTDPVAAQNLVTAVQNAAVKVSNDTRTVNTQLTTLRNKPITLDGGVATVVAIPGDQLGIAFYANGSVSAGGLFMYGDNDYQLIQSLATKAASWASITQTCLLDPVCRATYATLPNFSSSDFKETGIHARGVVLTEMGMAFSSDLGYMTWGLTPKIIKAQLYDSLILVNNTNQSQATNDDYKAEYSFMNFDLGIATYDKVGWRTGLVIKNIIPQTLDFKYKQTPLSNPLSLKPLARVGVSHTTSWSTVALDIDVTKNDPAGFEQATQYTALGIELNAFDWMQLRAGYRMDMVNSDRSVTSVGLGLSPFGIPHFDIAVAGNASEVGASLQFGVHF